MEQSFARADVGLGTAYERLAVYRLLDRWFGHRLPATALEGPVDGMAGMPGLHLLGLARRGVNVTVALPDAGALAGVEAVFRSAGAPSRLRTLQPSAGQMPEGRYELVLSYNALPLVPDWRSYLAALAGLAGRFLVVAVTNPASYGVSIRKAQRRLERRRRQELFDHESTRTSVLEPELARMGRIAEHAYFDCPWWPDLFVATGERLLGASLKSLPGIGSFLDTFAAKGPDPYRHTGDRFPMFEGLPGHSELLRALRRHPTFDGLGKRAGRAFGHLHAYLVEIGKRP
jgi:hypothetical protein